MLIFLSGLGIHHRKEGEGRTQFPRKSTVAWNLQVIAAISVASCLSKVTQSEKHIPPYANSLSCKVKVFPTPSTRHDTLHRLSQIHVSISVAAH